MVAIALSPGFAVLGYDEDRGVVGGGVLPAGILAHLRGDEVELGRRSVRFTDDKGRVGIADVAKGRGKIKSQDDLFDALASQEMSSRFGYEAVDWVPYEPKWLTLSKDG